MRARCVGSRAALGALLFVLFAAAMPAGAAETSESDLAAITQAPDGSLEVVRGSDVAEVFTDQMTGRSAVKVIAVEEPKPVRALEDPGRWLQWSLNAVSYEATWPTSQGTGVTVAIVDSGVDATHPDLAGAVLPGINLVNDGYDPAGTGRVDPNGHGTHVAGIVGARANNGIGIAGAAPGVQLLPVRVLDANGFGDSTDVAEGVIWAAEHGARVINLSLGGAAESPLIQTAMQHALSFNAVVVAAAGNEYQWGNPASYPAAYPEALAVSSVTSSLVRSSFSSTGAYVDMAAPGSSIVSAYKGGYALESGTSMAAPHVSAAAALLLAKYPSLTTAQARLYLESTATDLGASGRDDSFGYGLVNPQLALMVAGGASITPAARVMTQSSFNCTIRSQANDGYVAAELGYTGSMQNVLRARSAAVGAWERFRCESLGNGAWAIRSRANGGYVAAELGYTGSMQNVLRARSASVGAWERFNLTPVGASSTVFTLRSAAAGQFTSAELGYAGGATGVARARASAAQLWEQFTLRIDPS